MAARIHYHGGTAMLAAGNAATVKTAALGVREHAAAEQKVATCQSCSGRVRTAALGIPTHAGLQHALAVWWCCSGLMAMGAHATCWLANG